MIPSEGRHATADHGKRHACNGGGASDAVLLLEKPCAVLARGGCHRGEMTLSDQELLRRFAVDRSEPAFAEVVQRHIGLVHSAALRQLDGDSAAAEDITMSVFTDLARKASRLAGHTSLTGWLYTSTRYLATNDRRAEHRRRQREQEAIAMNRFLQTSEPDLDWERLRPVLDEAMHELGATDRDAVLLRFFERRPLAEVGGQLGIGENAARMRVERALDKLRRALARRGITSTVAALGTALAERTIGEVPAGLPHRVTTAAMAGATTGGGLLLFLFTLMARIPIKLLVGAAAVALLVTPVIRPWFASDRGSPRRAAVISPEGTSAGADVAALAAADAAANEGSTGSRVVDADVERLTLTLLAADTGKPIPNIVVARGWVTDARFTSLDDGTVHITYPKTTKELRLTTQTDGFADTCLKWNLERGEVVPATYTLKLERAVPIGGTVVDADGRPVEGTKVGFNHEEDPGTSTRTESHEFIWIQVATDDQGRWQINRMAEDIIRRVFGSAAHPDYVNSKLVSVRRDPAAEKELRAGTHVFQLGQAVTVVGTVMDTAGTPVPDAHVLVGQVGESSSREGTTGVDGTFRIHGCRPGMQLLSAEADGYAATTEEVEMAIDSAPFRLVMKPGLVLRLRIVGENGEPVPTAYIWLDTFDRSDGLSEKPKAPPVQTEVHLRSDADGRVVWEEAPDQELTFSIEASGHFRVDGYKVHPDGQEHDVIMPAPLTIFGTVRDAKTGAEVPKFRIITGWPQANLLTGTTNAAWSPLDRFWLSFGGGEFRHTFTEAVVGGIKNPGYVLKFEAEGYAPWVTRTVAADEGEVRLDIVLRAASATTITVVTPDGRVAANAEIALVSSGGRARLAGVGFDPLNSHGSVRVATDSSGQFQLPDDDSLVTVMASHPDGFATASPTGFVAGQTTWTLQSWGRIEGRWLSGDKVASGRSLMLEGVDGPLGPLQFEFTAFKVDSDGNGHFHYDRVPPGRVNLTRLQRSETGDGQVSWGQGRSTEVEVLPGKTTEVTFGGGGYQVTARLGWTDGKPSILPWQFHGSVDTPIPLPPPEVVKNPEAMERWWQVPEHQQAARAMKRFPMALKPDGSLLAEEVEPGNYVVRIGGFVPDSNGNAQAQAQAGLIPLSIPENPATGVIDLGVIPLRTEAASH